MGRDAPGFFERLVLKKIRGDVSSGGEGDMLKKVYWWLAGKKTKIGAALYIAVLAAQQLGLSSSYDTGIQYLANALMVVGLCDAAWRSNPLAIPEAWKTLYATLVNYAPITGVLVGYALDWIHTSYCGVTIQCPTWVHTVDRLAYGASGLGLIGALNLRRGPGGIKTPPPATIAAAPPPVAPPVKTG
jgi:hypothetical protein